VKNFSNSQISEILNEMAIMHEIKGVQFKPRAYERAAQTVASLDEEISDVFKKGGLAALVEISGIGKGIAEHMEELFTTGHFKEYEKIKKEIPVNVVELVRVEGVGSKSVGVLWRELKIKNINELEKAARAGKIRELKGFGEKTERKILAGIEFLKQSGGRFLFADIEPEAEKIKKLIADFPETSLVEIAGSYRRRKETIGDIDILVVSKKPESLMEKFATLPMVGHIYAKGPAKTAVRMKSGIDVDLRVVPEESWGAALNYFTGSKEHNVALRRLALKSGYKLNEYGLFKGKKLMVGKTEKEVYEKLGLDYIEPELRENIGEIETARNKKLPELVQLKDLRGDLQIQTDWTDGENSIEEMAFEAEKIGLEYILITDHTKSLAMAGGADEEKLVRQMKEIDAVNEKLKKNGKKITVLRGAEVNILKDGTLDINDETLSMLDVAGAAIHSHFNLPKKEQTERIIRVMENKNVDIIFHLTTRIINRRKSIEIDIDEIIRVAKENGTVLEVDAFPDRLDIDDVAVKKCVEAGVKISIDTDAHSAVHLKFLKYGVNQARRGWAKKDDVINTLPLKDFMARFKDRQ